MPALKKTLQVSFEDSNKFQSHNFSTIMQMISLCWTIFYFIRDAGTAGARGAATPVALCKGLQGGRRCPLDFKPYIDMKN